LILISPTCAGSGAAIPTTDPAIARGIHRFSIPGSS
jgi:hypothetical protein